MAIGVTGEPPAPRGERVRRRRSLLAHIGADEDCRRGTAESATSASSACRTETSCSDEASLSEPAMYGERRGSFSHHHLQHHLQRTNRRETNGFGNATMKQIEIEESLKRVPVSLYSPRDGLSRSQRSCQSQQQCQDQTNLLHASGGKSLTRQRRQGPRKFVRRFSQEGHANTGGTSQPETSRACNLVIVSNSLLQSIRDCLSERLDHEVLIDQRITVHTDRARARYWGGNTKGALLSMKKIKKLEVQQTNIAAAITHLRTAEAEVMIMVEKAEYNSLAYGDGGGGSNSGLLATAKRSPLAGELAQYSGINDDVERIMSRENSTESLSEEGLLADLTHMTETLVTI